jgi:hypothetical protein
LPFEQRTQGKVAFYSRPREKLGYRIGQLDLENDRRRTVSTEHVETLQQARAKLVEARHEIAKKLAGAYQPNAAEEFRKIQETIQFCDDALDDEDNEEDEKEDE